MAFAYDGAWAEYTVAQAVGLTRVPDAMSRSSRPPSWPTPCPTPFGAVVRTGARSGIGGVGRRVRASAAASARYRAAGATGGRRAGDRRRHQARKSSIAPVELGADYAFDAATTSCRTRSPRSPAAGCSMWRSTRWGSSRRSSRRSTSVGVGGRLVGGGNERRVTRAVGPDRHVRTHAEARAGPPSGYQNVDIGTLATLVSLRSTGPRRARSATSVSLEDVARRASEKLDRQDEQPDPDPGPAVTALTGRVAPGTRAPPVASGKAHRPRARRRGRRRAACAYGRHGDDDRGSRRLRPVPGQGVRLPRRRRSCRPGTHPPRSSHSAD